MGGKLRVELRREIEPVVGAQRPVNQARAAALPWAHASVGVSELTSKILSSLATSLPLVAGDYNELVGEATRVMGRIKEAAPNAG